jgi:hypothetical protein
VGARSVARREQYEEGGVTYEVRIIGSWWRGYWVATFADGREGVRVGPFRTRREAEPTVALQHEAYGIAPRTVSSAASAGSDSPT